jgi:hypothetical protein
MSVSVWPSQLPVFKIGRQPKLIPRSESVQMETGRIRNRRKYLVSVETIDVTWTFVWDQFEIFEEYAHSELENGSLPFWVSTYTPNANPGLLTEAVREYAFLDSQYLFSRRDNEFEVTATLLAKDISTQLILNPTFWSGGGGGGAPWIEAEPGTAWEGTGPIPFIPELEITMGPCNATFVLAWGDSGSSDSLELEVETAPGLGVYEPLLTLEGEDLSATDSVTLDNKYEGLNIRARFVVGGLHSKDSDPVTTVAPDVASPTVASFSGASLSSAPTPTGVLSHADAPLLVPSGSYTQVDARYDYNPDESGVAAPTFNLPPGTVLRVTSDGSTPTASSPSAPMDPTDEDFAGVYKVVAMDSVTGCLSPPLVVVPDPTWDLITNSMMLGTGSETVGGCRGPDYLRFMGDFGDGAGWIVRETTGFAGDSCQVLNYPASAIAGSRASAEAAKAAGNCVPIGNFSRGSQVNTPGVPEPDHGTLPDAWGGGYTIYSSVWTCYCSTAFHSTYVLATPKHYNGTVEIHYGDLPTSTTPVATPTGAGAADAVNAAVDAAMAAIVTPSSTGDLSAAYRLSILP